VGETAGADCPPGPDHKADGGAAACNKDGSLSADLDVDQDGDDGKSSTVSTDGESVDTTDVRPAAFVAEEPADEAGPAAELIGLPEKVMQDLVSCNEVQLPVTPFAENAEDLALFTYSVNHDLTEAALADLLQLRACKATYRTPHLIRNFIEACIDIERRQVDCCINGCLGFTHTRSEETVCDACGAARYAANGQPVRKIAYWPLTGRLVNMLSDPILGPDMMAGMSRARHAAATCADGKP